MKKPNQCKLLLSVASLVFVLGAAGCSSSSVNNEPTDESAPPADAGTDSVPQPGADGAAPADLTGMDPNALPPVDGAPPVDSMAQQTAAELAALQQTNPNGENLPPPPMDAPPGDAPPPPAPDALAQPPVAAAPEVTSPIMTPPDTSTSNSSSGFGGATKSHTVREGETLMQIAFEHTGDLYNWRAIYEANKDKISDPNHVPPGTELQIEDMDVKITKRGKRYLIKSGDTLGTISTDVYGMKTKWKRIWKNNPELIKDPNRIFAGFHLYYTFTKKDAEEKESGGGVESAPAPLANSPSMPSGSDQAAPSVPPAAGPDPVAGPRAPASN